jgi:hypothetical protein
MEEHEHLGGDAVYGAVDDADDGDREATRNLRDGKHGNQLRFLEAGREFVDYSNKRDEYYFLDHQP